MALVYVGKYSTGGAGTNLVLSLTALTGGIAAAAQAGDLAVVNMAEGNNQVITISMVTTGFTDDAAINQSDTRHCNQLVSHKILTADDISTGSVTVSGSADSLRGATAIVHVWRGADPTTPIDVAVQTAVAANSALADPPPITPVTTGAVVLGLTACTADSSPVAFNTPGDRSNWAQEINHGGSNRGGIATVGSAPWTSGAIDLAALTGGETSNFDSWCAVALALRPAAEAYGDTSLPPRRSLRPYQSLIGR